MKVFIAMAGVLCAGAWAALAAEPQSGPGIKPPAPKGTVTFEYTYPPMPPEKPKAAPEVAPIPRVGSMAWYRWVEKRERRQLAHWELRRLSAGVWSASEPPPSVNGFSSTWE
ncbi:MAG: hypothetical protein FJ388_03690 [Verrucomicrobia bacterium]|nr:hypothetical protein [Verrucomicrobiota bacterium]